MNELIQKFISNPEAFTLYRGESKMTQGGLHFTTDKEWARIFGEIILEGNLPEKSIVKLLTEDDFRNGYEQGISSEKQLWDLLFSKGYDAIIGVDSMNSKALDVIVNPKHLKNFGQ